MEYSGSKNLITILLVISISLPVPLMAETSETRATHPAVLFNQTIIEKNYVKTNLMVNPEKNPINAVGIYFNFSTSSLLATEINFEKSFCKLFIQNEIDNNLGQIKILCGLPNPGISEKAIIAQIKFQKKQSGWTSFSFDKNSQILKNDGKGTNILGEINNTDIYLE